MNGYNSRPIPNDTLFMDLKTPRFLVVEDLTERWKVQSIDVEIVEIKEEDTWPSMSDIDPQTKKPRVKVIKVMYFKSLRSGKEFERGMKLDAKENLDSLREATKARTKGDLIGKPITIKVGEWHKQKVLRISPTAPAQKPAAQPAPINQPEKVGTKLDELKAEAENDIITAYSALWRAAGLQNPDAQAILRECGGDMDAAFNKIAEQYAVVIG